MERYSSDRGTRPAVQVGSPQSTTTTYNQPVTATATASRQHTQKRRFTKKQVLIAIVLLALVIGALWWTFGRRADLPAYVDTGKYQEVVLTSQNAFYGKVTRMTDKEVILTDVFYIQQSTQTGNDSGKFELIKRGNEMHGPYDTMLINRSQVLYVENLRPDGDVTKKIKEYHTQNK